MIKPLIQIGDVYLGLCKNVNKGRQFQITEYRNPEKNSGRGRYLIQGRHESYPWDPWDERAMSSTSYWKLIKRNGKTICEYCNPS